MRFHYIQIKVFLNACRDYINKIKTKNHENIKIPETTFSA